jgi:hypothetical protein
MTQWPGSRIYISQEQSGRVVLPGTRAQYVNIIYEVLSSEVTLRLAVSQSVCFGVEPTLGLATRY